MQVSNEPIMWLQRSAKTVRGVISVTDRGRNVGTRSVSSLASDLGMDEMDVSFFNKRKILRIGKLLRYKKNGGKNHGILL